MSAFIEKDKLIKWLKERTDTYWWYDETNDLSASFDYSHAVSVILWEVEQGLFDWSGEGD